MRIRPRLLVVSLVVALIISVPAGWALSRWTAPSSAIPADEVMLDTPGEFQHPLDEGEIPADGAATGGPLPDIALEDEFGNSVRSGELVGTPAVINVWFSTCPPCARELSEFAEVHREVGDAIRFIGVNPFDGRDTMVSFARERGVSYELWRDVDGAFLDSVAVVTFPRTFFVDARGVIIAEAGVLDADQLREAIEEVF